jgi:cytochrome P450
LTTTSQLIGNLLHALLADRELERRVRAERTLIGTAIEESLRLSPPILFLARGCVAPIDVGKCPIEPGQRVIIGTASANRDERVFVEADNFDVERANADQHLTFGYGPHVCPGATLARVVARLAVEAFLDHFPAGTVELESGFEFEQVPTYFEHGPRRLPIVRSR